MLLTLPYPDIDPILFQIGPFALRWYSLAYIAGILLGWRYLLWLNRGPRAVMGRNAVDDLVVWITLGVILGGRLGSVLFYNLPYYLEHPLQIFAIWRGGMSFHGGLLGVITALVLFCWRRKLPLLSVADLVSVVAPIGLFFGRLANFVNAELWGRPTDVPWAMVFPTDPQQLPRHPSQLYEAALEGVLLFFLLLYLARRTQAPGHPGLLTGVFLTGYALARGVVELFRQPDAHIGFLALGITMGQLLSLPMLLQGLYLIWQARQPARTA